MELRLVSPYSCAQGFSSFAVGVSHTMWTSNPGPAFRLLGSCRADVILLLVGPLFLVPLGLFIRQQIVLAVPFHPETLGQSCESVHGILESMHTLRRTTGVPSNFQRADVQVPDLLGDSK